MRFIARVGDQELRVDVERLGSGYRVRIRDEWQPVDLVSVNPYLRSLRLQDGRQFLIVHHHEAEQHELHFGESAVSVGIHDPMAMRRRGHQEEMTGDATSIRAVIPGRVVRVLVQAGDSVRRGEGLLVVEAMKMENEITAPRDGSVAAVLVEPGQTVEGGAELIRLDP